MTILPMLADTSNHALNVAMRSRYPISANGDGFIFWGALFALLLVSIMLSETFVHLVKQLWVDRKRKNALLTAFRVVFLLVCITGLIRVVPDVAYRIAWGDASREVLQLLLSIKEGFNIAAGSTIVTWLLMFRYFEPLWTIRLNGNNSQVWTSVRSMTPMGNRKFVAQAMIVTLLSALAAGSITFYKAFS